MVYLLSAQLVFRLNTAGFAIEFIKFQTYYSTKDHHRQPQQTAANRLHIQHQTANPQALRKSPFNAIIGAL